MQLFWIKGFHATSMKDLESALFMKPGSIYAAFQSKEALFRATLDRYSGRMEADLSSLIAESDSPLSALQQHLLGLADLTPCDRPSTTCMLVKSLLEVPNEGDLRAFIIAHLDRIEAVIADALRRSWETGEISSDIDPERLARWLQTSIFGLKVQAQRETDPQRMRDLCSDLADQLCHKAVASRQTELSAPHDNPAA